MDAAEWPACCSAARRRRSSPTARARSSSIVDSPSPRHAPLGVQAVADPAAGFVEAIADPVVQARGASLPELETVGLQAVAAPVGRPRRIEAELHAELGG